MLGFGLLVAHTACRSPLTVRRDAGPDAGVASPDLASPDLPQPGPDTYDRDTADDATSNPPGSDAQAVLGIPKLFRFNNRTAGTAYVDGTKPVAGIRAVDGGVGSESCNYFSLGCMVHCANLQPGAACCVQCERPQPELLPIPPGESRTVPWTGNLYSQVNGYCADCACEGENPAAPGLYWAVTQVYAAYECEPPGCAPALDGLIVNARPVGKSMEYDRVVDLPSPDGEIVLDIVGLPLLDAGTSADVAPADLAPEPPDASGHTTDVLPPPFAEIPGHTYGIAASNTAPDASAWSWNWPCRPPDPNATYSLSFSADGSTVHVVRTDPVQEEMMDGTLSQSSDSQLVYKIDNHFLGAELIVRVEGGALAAELAAFGSGVPVIWCIESAMTAM